MSGDVSSPEIEKFTTLKKLYVLVHPLWRTHPYPDINYIHDEERFDRERRQMAQTMVDKMTPNNNSEATYFMPLVIEYQRRKDMQERLKSIKNNAKYVQWTDIYRNMVQKIGHGHALILGTNLVSNSHGPNPDPMVLLTDLNRRGLSIDDNTEIEVGGELLNLCLQAGIDKLLELPQIKTLTVNFDATLTSGYLFSSDKSLEDVDRRDFIRHFVLSNLYDVETEGNHCVISKKVLQ